MNKNTQGITDEEYVIDCTGDCVVGDEVKFERAIFSGSFKNPKFKGYETIEAKIIKSSYGRSKGQHTFTLQKKDGIVFRIKARNLYRNGVARKLWQNEQEREVVLSKKHKEGDMARSMIREKNRKCQELIEEGIDPTIAREITGATVKGAYFGEEDEGI